MLSVFLTGQKSFGAAALEMLEGHPLAKIVGVAAPGAGEDRLRHETVKRGLEWVPSETFRAEAVPECDLILAAHSHAYLSRKARSRAAHGAYGYHPSLLPRHRGRDAVRWTIHMRDPIAGGTVYYFTDNVDAGPVLLQDWCHVDPKWDAHTLWSDRLFGMGIDLLSRTVDQFGALGQRGVRRRGETFEHWEETLELRPQDEAYATWEPSWERPPLHRPDLLELNAAR